MRFPFRLSADLLKAKASRLLGGATPVIFHAVPGDECVTRAKSAGSPVVWLGGMETFLQPGIGRTANALVELDRYVFLHTSGYDLRPRIHEFRPDSRLFLTLEFAGREEAHNKIAARPDAFRRSLESIRAAKLSGFLVAAHITVTPETDACDVGELIEFLDKKDVDGFIVSSSGRFSVTDNASLAETLADVRAMIRCSRWENFSRLLDASYAAAPTRVPEKLSAANENAFEEGD
jgi:MoaA/NifB/PqqE/SkfB family radical SAM enzyme